MNADQLLRHLLTHGYHVATDGTAITVTGPAVTDKVRQWVTAAKPELIRLLQAKYVGWQRSPRGRWQAVTRGTTEEEAWRRLLISPPETKHRELLVTRDGKHPKEK